MIPHFLQVTSESWARYSPQITKSILPNCLTQASTASFSFALSLTSAEAYPHFLLPVAVEREAAAVASLSSLAEQNNEEWSKHLGIGEAEYGWVGRYLLSSNDKSARAVPHLNTTITCQHTT